MLALSTSCYGFSNINIELYLFKHMPVVTSGYFPIYVFGNITSILHNGDIDEHPNGRTIPILHNSQ